jgi:hypothetical protein
MGADGIGKGLKELINFFFTMFILAIVFGGLLLVSVGLNIYLYVQYVS